MIFKTIDDDSTLSGQRIVSVFEARRIAQEKVNASLREHAAQLEIDKAALTSLEQKVASGTTYEEAYAQSMKRASAAAKEHAVATKGVAGTTDTFVAKQKSAQAAMEATATSSKVAVVGVKALKLAFNMFSGIVVSFAISKIIEGFQYLAESAERAKEKLENIRTDLSENNSSYESNRKTLEGLRSEYDELTDKADKLGGVQNLANDEYERYKELTSEILGITPKLITGWDDEGTAISNKNGLLQQSIDLLDEEYEKSIRNNTTKSKNEDVANGVITELNDFNSSADTTTVSGTMATMREDFIRELESLKLDYSDLEKLYNYMFPDRSFSSDKGLTGTWESAFRTAINAEDDYEKLAKSFTEKDNPIYDLFPDDAIDQMIENANEYHSELDRIEDDRETYYQKYKDQLNWNAQAATDNSGENAYKQLSDESKMALTGYIDNLDYASIKTSDDFVDMANNVKSFTKLLASDSTLSDYMSDIYTPQGDNESIKDYSKRVNDAIEEVKKYIKDNNLNVSFDFGTDENPKGIKESVDKLEDSYDQAIDRFSNHATEKQNKALESAKQNLQDEYDKITGENDQPDFELGDYADQIKNKTVQTVFGNVDMDKRTIIHWSDELKQTYADALASWDYDPEVGTIDTVFGMSDRFGEGFKGHEEGWEVAFTPILPDGTFLSKDTVSEYINQILTEAYADDGKVTEDELTDIDAQGRQVGDTFVKGIFAGIDDSQNYDDNGNWAELVGRLMHFSGKFGAIQIAERELSDLEKQFGKDGSQTIKDFFNTEGINTQEEIDYFNDVTKNAKTAEEAIKDYTDAKKESNEPSILSTDELKEKLSDLNSAIDEIQSAYDTLTSACEEYNKNGGQLSIDTIQSLMGLSSEYLACLQDENGQLSINADAMAVLANAKLDEAQALAIEQAMTELNTIATGNHTKATADYVTGNAALLTSLQTLSGEYDEVASSAMTAAQAQALSAGIDAASVVDPEATKKTMDALNEKLKLISATRTQISAGNLGSLKKSGSSSKGSSSSSTDPIKEQFEAEYNLLKHNLEMEYITEEQYYNGVQALNEKYYAGKEKYLDEYRKYEEEVYKGLKSYYKSYCDDMMDYYDKKLDANKMSYKEYCDSVSKMLADMHNSGKISDKDWYDYTKTMLEKQKDIYEKALSAITRRLEKEIDTWQDKIDALNKENDNLNDQKDKMDSAIDAITKVYDTEIDRIQGIIDGLKDANDERERTLALEKAKYELERAYNQRVKKIYKEDQGFVYEADYESIRDKKDTLANAELDIKTAELQKQIDVLEEFKNKWQEVPNKFQEGIDHMNATALIGSEYQKTILNNNILDLENFQNSYISIQTKLNDNEQLIASYEEKIEYYEMLKEQWSSLSDEYSNNVEDMYAKQLLGQQWETDVLNGRIQTLNDFRNEYNRIQQAISDMAWNSANAQIAAQNAIKEAEATKAKTSGGSNGYSGSSGTATKVGSSGGSGTAAPKQKKCKIVDTNSGRLLHTSASESEVSNWTRSNGYIIVSSYVSKDGSYVTYEVRKANIKTKTKGYAKGTQNAERGIKTVSEEDDEIVISKDGAKLVHGEQLYDFQGGEKVIPANETKEILKNQGNVTKLPDGRELFEDGSIKFPDGTLMTPVPSLLGNITQTEFAKAMKNVPLPHYQQKPMNYSNITKTENNNNTVTIGDIHLHNVQNVDQLGADIDRYLSGIVAQKLNRRR